MKAKTSARVKRATNPPAPVPRENDLTIEWMPINSVKAYAKNPRVISDKAIAKVAASLKAFSWKQPIVVDSDHTVIVGHTRLMAAASLGLTEVPVHVAHNLTKAQANAYRLADNRTGEESRWDDLIVGEELSALKLADFDLSLTGFDLTEQERFMLDAPIVQFKEYDESAADDVKLTQCPKCGHQFPA